MMFPARTDRMATWVDLDRSTPSVLRHLAAAKERASGPAYDDTETMAEELAAVVIRGRRPTASTTKNLDIAPAHHSQSASSVWHSRGGQA